MICRYRPVSVLPRKSIMSASTRIANQKHLVSPDLGDFTTTTRVLWITGFAIVLGGVSAVLAWLLLRMIAFFTNIFFFGDFSTANRSPADNNLGVFVILIPVIGAIIIGLMARFGSERIRGHGIPEAIEAILIGGSRVQPRVALLKPLSSAISIGSGGPFGAEGPIIMTGGAVGSLVAQFFELTSNERKTLLVAGAAAGMSATFASPVAAVMLAIELLLFELKPRSVIPVAAASATAAVFRRYLLGEGPIFPMQVEPGAFSPTIILCCLLAGILAGLFSGALTSAVYAAEDFFQDLPIPWMWWPAIGGLAIGIGGLIYPHALGVGYDVIERMLQGDVTTSMILGVLLVKSSIWAISLGSGTSGGVLAPLLMMGGALGGLFSHVAPGHGPGFWPVIGMAAMLGGTMRAPVTALIFTIELTHNVELMLPLLIAVGAAHCFTVLVLKRSILTEKVSRRGFHLSREYAVDPLEILFTREVMRTDVVAIPASTSVGELGPATNLHGAQPGLRQGLYPVVDDDGDMLGIVTRTDIYEAGLRSDLAPGATVAAIAITTPIVAYPDEPLRVVAERMAERRITSLPVVERGNDRQLVGVVSLGDLLKGRARSVEHERVRERSLRVRLLSRRREALV
jgi:H+/Cl- antiporter ClcA/CBS domain-containing protein